MLPEHLCCQNHEAGPASHPLLRWAVISLIPCECPQARVPRMVEVYAVVPL